MTSIKDVGNLGYGIVGGKPAEAQLYDNFVYGCWVSDPTTASAQVTGAGDGTYRVDITAGIVHVDKTIKEFVVVADQLLETAGDIMADGNSKVYSVIAWRHPDTGAVALKIIGGTPATTGSQVAPTVAEIEALIPVNSAWVHIADVTVNRTGDTTVTQSQDNTKRPSNIPQTVNRN